MWEFKGQGGKIRSFKGRGPRTIRTGVGVLLNRDQKSTSRRAVGEGRLTLECRASRKRKGLLTTSWDWGLDSINPPVPVGRALKV